ncbi:hypothetical protein J4P41_14890, partial [Gluconobacter sp. NFX36]|uniref:hypothetical protein n=1 Tax=Gluconobacter sp. NFX36 TaxID=2819535 RepID=UPI003CF2B56D
TGPAALQHQRNQAASSAIIPNQRRRDGITEEPSNPEGFSNPPRSDRSQLSGGIRNRISEQAFPLPDGLLFLKIFGFVPVRESKNELTS